MRNEDDTVLLCCALSETEQDFVAQMKVMTGIASDANLVRLALYRLALHLDLPVIRETFHLRTTRGRKGRTDAHKLSQEDVA